MPLTEAGAAVLSAGIGAASQLGSSVVKNRKSYKYSKKLADYQNSINIDNWHKQNLYNSPTQQMARLKAAGLNPNLVYQNGGATTGAGEIASPSVGQFDYTDPFQQSIGAFQNVASSLANVDSVAAEIDKKVAETAGISADNLFKIEHSKHVSQETKNWLAQMNANTAILEQQKKLLTAQTGLTSAQAQDAVLRWSLVPKELKKLDTEIKLNEANKRHLYAMVEQVNANKNYLTAQYQKALIEKALMEMQQAAEQKAGDNNTYSLMIRQLSEQVADLQFRNSPINRRHELNPSANVPEAINIYREYRGKSRLEDQLQSDWQDWQELNRESREERARERERRRKAFRRHHSSFQHIKTTFK